MIVVAVAMIGSLTVLPAMLVVARRPRREGPRPVPRPAQERRRRGTPLGCDPQRRPAATGRLGDRRHGSPARAGGPGAQPAHRTVRASTLCRSRSRRCSRSTSIQDAFPGGAAPRRGDQGRRLDRSAAPGRSGRSPTQQALAPGKALEPIYVDVAPTRRGSAVDDSARRQRHRHRVERGSRTLRNEILPATIGTRFGRRVRRHRRNRVVEGLELQHEVSAPIVFLFVLASRSCCCCVSFRSIVIPIKAILMNLLSVARRLRPAGRGLPVGLGREPARLPLERRHRLLAARCSCS